MDERELLLEKIRPQFSFEKLNATICGQEFDYIGVADEEEVLRLITDESGDDPQFQPYWALPWESSIGLCERLFREPLAGKTVLDIGCGLGLVGTFAAAQGAHVVMGDVVPAAKMFVEYNSWRWKERVEARVLDWRKDDLQTQFDYVVGADILYQESDWSYLDRFWKLHTAINGQVFIAEPNRLSGREFIDWLDKQSVWKMEEDQVSVPPKTIRLFDLSYQ